MTVDVSNLKEKFSDKVCDLYNKEVYFIDTCEKFPSKYSQRFQMIDMSLRIFFEENNKIIMCGKCLKYCDKSRKQKIKIHTISLDMKPDVTINNYIITDDRWEQTDW